MRLLFWFTVVALCTQVSYTVALTGPTKSTPTTKASNKSKVVKVTTPKPQVCPPNEEYSQCGSNACQNTCVDPTLEQLSSGCSCSPGCVCIPGLLRNQGGLCVAPEDCNIVTSCFFENEVFSKCDAHPCQNTCADPDLITRCDYTAGCYPGCNCAEGYLRSLENNCVLATSNTCVKKCPGPNEIYRESESGCRGTCLTKYIFEGVDLATVSMACVLPSTAGGCYCQIDYVLNEKTNQCVLPDNCPPPCEPNEVFDMCPPKSPAEVTCVNIFKGTTPVKPTECVMECKCKPGLVRIGKECVAPEKCCSDPNAELVKNPHCCGGGTCAKPDWITGCGKKSDPKGCQCKKGYCKKSETDATCIAVKNCKKPTTGHCSK
nr:zonadhesin-like protein 5 [Limnephilus flavicornis]